MASKKKASEGIALLSMYNDEDMDVDDDDEDTEEEEEEAEDGSVKNKRNDPMEEDRFPLEPAYGTTPPIVQSQTPIPDNDQTLKSPAPPTPVAQIPRSPTPPLPPPVSDSLDAQRMRKGAFGIVDYAHDETAMSPDAEEGEIVSVGNVMLGKEFQVANGNFQDKTPPGTVQILTPNIQATPPQSVEQLEQSNCEIVATRENTVSRSEEVQVDVVAIASIEIPKENVDPLEKFLPPPPKTKFPEELQELQRKINWFLELKKKGKSFNADLRNRKDYRNPDFLLHAVSYQDIDQIGTCFSKDVFDPHGYDKSDYYDEIEADLKREMERKEQEKKKSQKVEFVPGASQPGTVASAQKIGTQIAGAATTGAHTVQPAVDATGKDSRQNKKTKWDKVDGDRRNPLHSGGQDTISTAGAHAALLSAANAGAGYTAFAQQKRREAEEKRSSERRLEKRS